MPIRLKVILTSVIILFASMAGSTYVTAVYFSDQYLSARKSEVFVIAQTLKSQLDRLIKMHIPVSELVGFEDMCREAVLDHRSITYAMVLDMEGTILFHSNPERLGMKITDALVLNTLGQGKKKVQETQIGNEKFYDFFMPVSEKGAEPTACIRVGFPRDHIAGKTKKLAMYSSVTTLIVFAAGALILVGMLNKWVGKPVTGLINAVETIRKKGVAGTAGQVDISSRDEIGRLAATFNKMTDELQETTVSKAYVDYILEHMLNSLVITDSHNVIRFVNQETLNILGYRRQELIGKPLDHILDKKEDLRIALNCNNDPVKALEYIYLSKEGKRIPILFSSSLLPKRGENGQGSICVAQDLTETRMLQGMIPICASCKKIRDDQGYWNQVEAYISLHSGAEFSHSICPECSKKLYGDLESPASASGKD